MQDLIILGLGAHGPEIAEIVDRVNSVQETWNLLGFISPDGHKIGEHVNGYPVLGTIEVLKDYPNAGVVPICEVPQRSEVPRHQLVSVIDPSTFVSRTAQIGVGCVIFPHCFVFCLSGCIINHDDVIEPRVLLASGVTLLALCM